MKMTEKTKRRLAVGAGVVLCVGLIAGIALRFGKTSAGEDRLPEESTAVTEIIVDPSEIQTEGSREEPGTEELVIQPETGASGEAGETSAPVDSRPAQTDQTEQSIQPDVTKPEPPSEQALTDPTQMPDGTKLETPPVPVEHEEVVTPTEPTPEPGEPQAGDTQNGQIYVPGFGWVENHGGGGSGTVAEDMYENGNKIGSMD